MPGKKPQAREDSVHHHFVVDLTGFWLSGVRDASRLAIAQDERSKCSSPVIVEVRRQIPSPAAVVHVAIGQDSARADADMLPAQVDWQDERLSAHHLVTRHVKGGLTEDQLAGKFWDQRHHNPCLVVGCCKSADCLRLYLAGSIRLPLEQSESLTVRVGHLWLRQVPDRRTVTLGVPQPVIDDHCVWGKRTTRHRDQDQAVTGFVRVFYAQDVDYGHGNNLRPYDLPNPSLVGLRHGHARRGGGPGLIVLFDPKDEQPASGVGKRGNVSSGISTVSIRRAVHLRLEVKIERFWHTITDQGH